MNGRSYRANKMAQAGNITADIATKKINRAIANHLALDIVIDEMREITQKLILETPETASFSKHRNHSKPALT